jgi:DNA-binding NtrC family response regulator
MSNVWIVARRDSFDYPIESISSSTIHCQVLSPAEVEINPARSELTRPDLLVVDLQSIQQPVNQFMEHLSQINPEAAFIVLASPGAALGGSVSSHYAVDEIINRPSDGRQIARTVEELSKRITVFDRLHGVLEKLHKEMHQHRIVVRSQSMREIVDRLPQLASSLSTILITGETGTGKELVARAIHYLGPRAGRPFITVDCGTIPEYLVENELFGHARGAYTDAGVGFRGLIQEADGGTLFLDEVEALPISVQSKFLRFLQEHQYKPLGQSRYVSVDVHVVASTNVDLLKSVERKLFREDLYYRLKVVPLTIPPLRERKADIPRLVRFFLQRYGGERHTLQQIPLDTIERWMDYDWPGNVRELENKIQEWLATTDAGKMSDFTQPFDTTAALRTLAEVRRETLARCEEKYFQQLMTLTKGNVSAAARVAGIDRKNLRGTLKKYSIQPDSFRPKRS